MREEDVLELPDSESEVRQRIFEKLDSASSIAWYLMGGFWMYNWKQAAFFAACFLIGFYALSCFYAEKTSFRRIAIILALGCWAFYDAFWMSGDLNKIPRRVFAAKIIFWTGIIPLLAAMVPDRWTACAKEQVNTGFRRLRLYPKNN